MNLVIKLTSPIKCYSINILDPQLLNLVELTLNIEARLLTKSQKDSLVVKLQMLLRDEANIVVRNLRAEPRTGRAVLIFYVDKDGGKSVLTGPEVVQRLKQKLRQDSGLLQLSVANVETAICQNKCSGIEFHWFTIEI